MKQQFLIILSVVVLLFVCFSCNNEVETATTGTYSKAEKEEFIELAEQYGAEVVFIDDKFIDGKLDRKISIEEFERMLIALKGVKAEFSLPYKLFYKTPTGITIPKSRSNLGTIKENHPVGSFNIQIDTGESFSCFGEVDIFFTPVENSKRIEIRGHVSYHTLETISKKGYTYTIEPEAVEKIEPPYINEGDNGALITFSNHVMIEGRLDGVIKMRKHKVFKTTVPADYDGTEVQCTVEEWPQL